MKATLRRTCFGTALLAIGIATGCGGGGTLPAPRVSHPGSTGYATATFRIDYPKTQSSSASRSPKYLSPATQAMTITTTGPTVLNETVALTTSSSGCTSTLASTVCTLQVSLTPGAYTATLKTYDSYNAVSQTASGNLLSQANIAFTIAQGQSNNINVTLSGVIANTIVVPGNALVTSSATGVMDLIGQGAHALLVESLDADGNIIVGAGAPTYVVGTPSSGLSITVSGPTASAPNLILVTPPQQIPSFGAPPHVRQRIRNAPPGGGGTSTFTVTPSFVGQTTDGCSLSGANCSAASVTVDMQQMVAVADCESCGGGSSSANNVAFYEDGGSNALMTLTNGVGNPVSLAYDSSGNLFVGTTTGLVSEYSPPFYTLTKSFSVPSGSETIAIDSTGNLAAGNGGGSSIDVLAPPYTGAPAVLAASSLYQVMFDPFDNLWVSDSATTNINQYTAPYSTSQSPAQQIPVPFGATGTPVPMGIASSRNGDLAVADSANRQVDVYYGPTPGPSTSPSAISLSPDAPESVVFDPHYDLYAAAYNGSSAGIDLYGLGAFSYGNPVSTVVQSGGVTASTPIALGAGNFSGYVGDVASNALYQYTGNMGFVNSIAPAGGFYPTAVLGEP